MSQGIPLVEQLADEVVELVRPGGCTPNRQDVRQRFDVREAEQDYRGTSHALHNSQQPNLVVEHEKPEHRIILLLKLKGFTNREIAESSGYTEPWISQITRQPWFKERLTRMLDEAGDEVLNDLIRVEGKNSFITLLHLRDNARSEQVRLTAAVNLVDRLLGKPVQRTENTTNVFHVSTKLEELNEQIRKVEEEERKLLGQGNQVEPPKLLAESDRFKP